ncbi:MAG TPA: hypothetical protein VNX65_01055 [Patescibacteria group bacterium]|jgi:hypothetical protein|nr:hypothetical protein [Patescibacteria group bacterium]
MKPAIYIGASIGGIVGGYIPVLWGAGLFDLSSILLGAVGTALGAWLGYKAAKYYGL